MRIINMFFIIFLFAIVFYIRHLLFSATALYFLCYQSRSNASSRKQGVGVVFSTIDISPFLGNMHDLKA